MDELSESVSKIKIDSSNEETEEGSIEDGDKLCCICREPYVHPVLLPCSHVFCFLCIKGVAVRSKRCALCRTRIPSGYLSNPSLINKDSIKANLGRSEGEAYEWYYEARSGGWWLFEERLSKEIEAAYKEDEKLCRLQISGFPYVIDFELNMQYREDLPNRRRRIKRDKIESDVRGISGIVLDGPEGDSLK